MKNEIQLKKNYATKYSMYLPCRLDWVYQWRTGQLHVPQWAVSLSCSYCAWPSRLIRLLLPPHLWACWPPWRHNIVWNGLKLISMYKIKILKLTFSDYSSLIDKIIYYWNNIILNQLYRIIILFILRQRQGKVDIALSCHNFSY